MLIVSADDARHLFTQTGPRKRKTSRNAAFASIVRATRRSRLPTHALTRCAVLAIAIAALGLSGCGRRGNLEPPPGSGQAAAPAATNQSIVPQGLDGAKGTDAPVITAPKQPFILDPLL